MQDSTGRESKNEPDAAGSDSDATSKELLSDVEEIEEDTGSISSEADPGPSPDGGFDESDETKDAGPI
ncbi:MAG: hypothetical protein H0U60_11795 [Blastocatellia bacterium]|nr:hypothetical protein [Blastocatellia bacterium]